jgi:hypothetical protein
MFMLPKDIKKSYGVHKDELSDPRETKKQLYSRKLKEANRNGLTDKIVNRGGVRDPIFLSSADKTIADGHHRIAVASKHLPNTLVPVHHLEPEEL